MKKLFLVAAFLCVALAYTGCTKDNVTPAKATSSFHNAELATAPDTTGGQDPPVHK